MSNSNQKLKTGIFIVSGVLLLLAMLFFLGLSDIFVDKVKLITCFQESVQGLSVGSPVKYRGVQVGSVSEISIMMQEKTVWVTMEIEPRYFHAKEKPSFAKSFKNEISHGLGCRLEFAGITGMKFIDFDYFRNADNEISIPDGYPGDSESIFIPGVPSTFQDISKAVINAMERLSKIKFEEISAELETGLNSINTLLADPAIKATIAKLNEAADNLEVSTAVINNTLDGERLTKLLDALENSLKSFGELADSLNKTSSEMKLPESTKAIRDAANSITENRSNAAETFQKLNNTLDAIRIFFDNISDDPSSIIRGKESGKILE